MIIFFFVSLITYFCFLVLKGREAFVNLEKSKYNISKFKKWVFTKKNFLTLELLGIFIIIIAFRFDIRTVGICTIVFYLLLSLLKIKSSKNKLEINESNKRQIWVTILVYVLIFGLIFIDYYIYQKGFIFYNRTIYYYPIAIIVGYLQYPIIYLVSAILKQKKK